MVLRKAALEVACSTSQHLAMLTKFEIDGYKLLSFLRNRLADRMEAIAVGYGTWNKKKHDSSLVDTHPMRIVLFLLKVESRGIISEETIRWY